MTTTDPALNDERATLAQTSRRAWRYATLLAFVALTFAALLGGLSAWFLGAVALAGLSTATALVFNFHTPGALVRLFAVGRTVARYGERLTGHKGALTDQVLRRASLFHGMARAPGVRAAGWQLSDQARLADYLDDVEDLDFGKLRVNLPAMTMGFGLAAGVVASLAVAPLSLVPIAIIVALTALGALRLVAVARATLRIVRMAGRDGAFALGAALASVVPLKAEGALNAGLGLALDAFRTVDVQKLRLRNVQADVDMFAGLVGSLAGASVIAAAWYGGARGEALLAPVFVAFAWLALSESFQGVSRIVVAECRRRLAGLELEKWTAADEPAAPALDIALTRLSHPSLQRLAPDGRALSSAVTLDLEAGRPTVLVGVSGSGKTSLLKQIAGWTGEDTLTANAAVPLSARERRGLAMFCPHDAAILADTVRANLFAPEADDNALHAALEAVEMTERVEKAGGLDGWITQEGLSLGEAQRLNLARAWLSTRPLILLDEPSEHLDEAQAARIIARLGERLADRILVISSHHPLMIENASIIDLDSL